MARIITFGELMLRLQPYNYERFVQCDHVEFTFGGGEANVAVSLANYGMDVAYVTKLPTHAIGQSAVNSLRRYGVDTSLITRGGDRIGIYFNEKGASQRGSVCISNEEDAKDVFGIEAEATDIYAGSLNHEGYKSVAKQLADKFGFEMVAITLRESHSAFDNGWSAMLYNVAKDEYCFSKKYNLHIIDRVGGGDSFGGGLIYSMMNGKDTQAAVEFAVAASALKHSIEGDYNMVTLAEVEKLAGGDGSGRIQR